ncbi:hypothetical protein Pelo_16405 [Pelomyxa schiedti]|nr:hypothetical protein Pelo_16405 [Pelomyxa schiedti]
MALPDPARAPSVINQKRTVARGPRAAHAESRASRRAGCCWHEGWALLRHHARAWTSSPAAAAASPGGSCPSRAVAPRLAAVAVTRFP